MKTIIISLLVGMFIGMTIVSCVDDPVYVQAVGGLSTDLNKLSRHKIVESIIIKNEQISNRYWVIAITEYGDCYFNQITTNGMVPQFTTDNQPGIIGNFWGE